MHYRFCGPVSTSDNQYRNLSFSAWKTLSPSFPFSVFFIVLYLSQGLHSQGCLSVCVCDEKSALTNDWGEIAQCWQDMTGLCLGTFKTLWWVSADRRCCGATHPSSAVPFPLDSFAIALHMSSTLFEHSLNAVTLFKHCSKYFFLDSLIVRQPGTAEPFSFPTFRPPLFRLLCLSSLYCVFVWPSVVAVSLQTRLVSCWQRHFVMCVDPSSAACNSLHSLDKWRTRERRLVCS